MAPDFAGTLPQWLRMLIDETEASIGFEIQVVAAAERSVMACEFDVAHAVIQTPSNEAFGAGSVFHELLHIRRMLVDGVPRLVLADSYPDGPNVVEIQSSLVRHDNALEHLAIVPMELDRVPDRKAHWEAMVGRNWAALRTGTVGNDDQTPLALAMWVFMEHVLPGSPSRQAGEAFLARAAIRDRADAALAAMIPALGDKISLTKAWCEASGVSPSLIDFEFADPATGNVWRVPMEPPAA